MFSQLSKKKKSNRFGQYGIKGGLWGLWDPQNRDLRRKTITPRDRKIGWLIITPMRVGVLISVKYAYP